MDKKKISELENQYIKGECSPDEKYLLDKYLESFQKEETNWDESVHGNKLSEKEEIYNAIMRKIRHKQKNIIVRAFYSSALLKAAASILILLSLSVSAYLLLKTPQENEAVIAWVEKATVPGEKAVVTLNDNTRIILNAASRLKYTRTGREVYLEGEAYFEVTHDTSKPFMVHSADITTTVLGTKFDVNAYKTENNISVSLLEGMVKVSHEKKTGTEDLVVLNPKQQLVFNKDRVLGEVHEFDPQKEVGWKDNILKFKNVPLEKVLAVLERTFGVKFELAAKEKAKIKITANFKNDSIQIIAEALKNLTGLQYKIEKENNETKKIKLYKK